MLLNQKIKIGISESRNITDFFSCLQNASLIYNLDSQFIYLHYATVEELFEEATQMIIKTREESITTKKVMDMSKLINRRIKILTKDLTEIACLSADRKILSLFRSLNYGRPYQFNHQLPFDKKFKGNEEAPVKYLHEFPSVTKSNKKCSNIDSFIEKHRENTYEIYRHIAFFKREYLAANRMTLVIISSLDVDYIKSLVDEYFEVIPSGEKKSDPIENKRNSQHELESIESKRDYFKSDFIEQFNVKYAVPTNQSVSKLVSAGSEGNFVKVYLNNRRNSILFLEIQFKDTTHLLNYLPLEYIGSVLTRCLNRISVNRGIIFPTSNYLCFYRESRLTIVMGVDDGKEDAVRQLPHLLIEALSNHTFDIGIFKETANGLLEQEPYKFYNQEFLFHYSKHLHNTKKIRNDQSIFEEGVQMFQNDQITFLYDEDVLKYTFKQACDIRNWFMVLLTKEECTDRNAKTFPGVLNVKYSGPDKIKIQTGKRKYSSSE